MWQALFEFFESRIKPTNYPPQDSPPKQLLAFYGYFIGQSKGLFASMLLSCLLVALSDTVTPVLIGKLVGLMTASDRASALQQAMPMLLWMLGFLLVLRPAALLVDSLLRFNAVMGAFTSMVRWQNHWHVVRQSWPFFRTTLPGASPTA